MQTKTILGNTNRILFFGSTWDWNQVSRAIGEHSNMSMPMSD